MDQLDVFRSQTTVAILTALPKEFAAMRAMLDDPVELSTPGNAPGEYVVGSIPSKEGGKHIVLLANCSVAENLAAVSAAILLERFNRITTVVMMGIAGGAPDPSAEETDVRLGDVVVSGRLGTVQYDFDKEVVRDGKVIEEPRHNPRPPSYRLQQSAEYLEALELEGKSDWRAHILRSAAVTLPKSARPNEDVLYDHQDPSSIVKRSLRADPSSPRVFTGVIASGNKLLKNAKLRERLRQTFGAKAVEMEAAGVADAAHVHRAGYFVVRGICDYCDDYKNDDWQAYAAIVAAAYTRGLLEVTRSESVRTESGYSPSSLQAALGAPTTLIARLEEALPDPVERSDWFAAVEALVQSTESVDSSRNAVWPARALNTTERMLTSARRLPPMTKGELLIIVAFPTLIGHMREEWKRCQFERQPNDEWYADLAANFEAFTDLPEDAKPLVVKAAVSRLVRRWQTRWSDSEIRSCCPDAPLARWLAADTFLCALVRATAGDMVAFAHLPEVADFTFEARRLSIRWKDLACMLVLIELRTLGIHWLPAAVVESLAFLPDASDKLSTQLASTEIVDAKGNSWILRATCDDPMLDHALTELARSLNDAASARHAMSDYLVRAGYDGFPQIDASITPALDNNLPRYTTPHVSFLLSARHAQRLFMGSDLWGNEEFAYRELFQNALDACRYRLARSQHLGVPYDPVIRIFHGRGEDGIEFVECEDNGIGMDRHLIASCFAIAGNRFVQTEEYKKEQSAWRAAGISHKTNSQFGIGVFSYFLVADRLEVETTRLDADGQPGTRLAVSVATASSFFRIVSISNADARAAARVRAEKRGDTYVPPLDAGTRVRLYLRSRYDEKLSTDEASTCVDAIRRNVWYSEIRTEVRDFRGNNYDLEPGKLAPWIPGAVRATGTELAFWWLAETEAHAVDTSGPPMWLFRSRHKAGTKSENFSSAGRVLVDGIVTEAATPGFIVNLDGERTPKLSLNRREIRSDIRDVLERAVEDAMPHLPSQVSWEFLDDLWLWDPRVCHRIVFGNQRGWHRRDWGELGSETRLLRRAVNHPYFPSLPDPNSWYERRDEVKVLFELWRVACELPDARSTPAFILESRGVKDVVRSNLKLVPDSLWTTLANTEFGIPEAAALHRGLTRTHSDVLTAYMSWQTGETIATCSERLVRLANFLGYALGAEPRRLDVVVCDHDAWLLGRGSPHDEWCGPRFKTSDVFRFCARVGRPFTEVHEHFRELAQKLTWELTIDSALASEIGELNHEELQFMSSLESDSPYIVGLELSNLVDRAALIGRLVGRPLPKVKLKSAAPVLNDEEKAIAAKFRWRNATRHVSLAEIAEVARQMKRPIGDALRAVHNVVIALGLPVTFDRERLARVEVLSDAQWRLAEGSGFLGQSSITPCRDALSLARRLRGNHYLFWSQPAERALEVLRALYDALDWGDVPLTIEQVTLVLGLTEEVANVLDRITSPAVSVARALVISLELGRTLASVADDLGALASLGVTTPTNDETYLGLSWQSLTAGGLGEVQAQAVGPVA